MIRDQKGVWAYCESVLNGDYNVDQIVPLSRGSCNDWPNLAVTCENCNCSKGVMTAQDFFSLISEKSRKG